MQTERPDPAILDAGIRDTVLALYDAGFSTFTSCEGGKGHNYALPTVGIYRSEYEHLEHLEQRLVRWLTAHDYTGFETHVVRGYQRDPSPWKPDLYSFVLVHFWRTEGDRTA